MRNFAIVILIILPFFSCQQEQQPKIVVGIVVDQMRYDYINRFWDKYGDGGFKKMVNNGFSCNNTHYNYMPTYTAPGHASIYTGTTPQNHGIIANTWYDKNTKQWVYCTGDSTKNTVGTTSAAGNMSPKNMLSTTITDELKLATNNKGKVIGMSIKDRGAILPAGHQANAAYWYEGDDEGKWISSSYYMEELPQWVQEVNATNTANSYLNGIWETILPLHQYTESIADNNAYEGTFVGEAAPVFPHNLKTLRDSNHNYSLIKATPYGNTILKELALAAIEGEKLGTDEYTDFLAISFSSPDYIGHQYGPMSVEIEDTYIRLDKDIEAILNFLEQKVGKDNFLVFLTADHGAVDVPQYLIDNNLSAGYFNQKQMVSDLKTHLHDKFKVADLIANVSNYQVFLNHKMIENNDLNLEQVEQAITTFLLAQKGISKAVSSSNINAAALKDDVLENVQRGFHPLRSGDVLYVLKSGWISSSYTTGTTHGSPYNYDTHVPLLWYGAGVQQGASDVFVAIPDIAATLAALLQIQQPSECSGVPVVEVLKK